MKKDRYFFMKDIEATIIVEHTTKKDLLSWLAEYVEMITGGYGYAKDDTYEILYTDGTTDYINEEYDGHKIRKTNIAAIVNSNASTYLTYGKYEVSETGVVYAAFDEKIDNTNIVEINSYI